MSNICKTVSLRTRKIKDGRMLPYYLDYYSGYRDVTFRASINTAYRDRKIKENPNGFLDRINTISLEVLLLKHYSVIDAPSSWHACTKCRFTHRYIKFVHHFKYGSNIIFCFKNKQINAFADFC